MKFGSTALGLGIVGSTVGVVGLIVGLSVGADGVVVVVVVSAGADGDGDVVVSVGTDGVGDRVVVVVSTDGDVFVVSAGVVSAGVGADGDVLVVSTVTALDVDELAAGSAILMIVLVDVELYEIFVIVVVSVGATTTLLLRVPSVTGAVLEEESGTGVSAAV